MASKRWVNEFLENAALTLFCVVGVLLAPLWIPLACVFDGRDARRRKSNLLAAAGNTRCTTCAELLGGESLQLADAEWNRYLEDLHRDHPGSRFRLVRRTHAICPNCRSRYRYLQEEKRFVEHSS